MPSYQSRLARRYERASQLQIVGLVIGSITTLVLIIVFGIPLLFKLSGALMGLRPTTSIVAEKEIPPPPPQLYQTYSATKSAEFTLTGITDPKTMVEIYQNDNLIKTVSSDETGIFKLPTILDDGNNIFAARNISNSGKVKSDMSVSMSVLYSKKGPKLEISDSFNTSESPFTISGKTDKTASITVNNYFAIVSNDGSFSYLLNLSEGENKIKVVASDQAGNTTEKEVTIKYSP